jgi:hypothetical protein
VLQLDPKVPAALSDARVGDRIYGYFPPREERPTGIDLVDTRFHYGLNLVEPRRSGTYLDIKRQGKRSK